MNVLIIGYGVVGQNIRKIFPDAYIHDPEKGRTAMRLDYDVAFIAVPTDMKPDGSCDTSIVERVVREWAGSVKIFCIRSTVPPGTTDRLNDIAPCVFQPEYYGGTQHANGYEYDYTILGGETFYSEIVAELYRSVYTADHKIFLTTAKTAELVKYMENSWLATKVVFCNEFYRIAKKMDINYDTLREMWLLDPRINRSHSYVYMKKPYYDSHCLNKDVPAIIAAAENEGAEPKLLRAVIQRNGEFKRG
jgi:UDPglucose 6-dehydrogenase